jgi:hypothetical protein
MRRAAGLRLAIGFGRLWSAERRVGGGGRGSVRLVDAMFVRCPARVCVVVVMVVGAR